MAIELIEIRELDGPNYFAPFPVIKLEICVDAHEHLSADALSVAATRVGHPISDDPASALVTIIPALHIEIGEPPPTVQTIALDESDHVAIVFDWKWRETGLRIARTAYDLISGSPDVPTADVLAHTLAVDQRDNDVPLWVRDDRRRIPTVGITATNGKTTTTRLIAHIVRLAGKHVGWSSSTGVYIDGEQVIEGDYTGPAGARRVLDDPNVDIAVLETARGGILLRGLAYESNDVGVFLNVSPDHLDMQGVKTVETLAEVKGIVVRVTRPDGLVVLNADDPLVMKQRDRVRANLLLFSQLPDSPIIAAHEQGGGKSLVRFADEIQYFDGTMRQTITMVEDLPMAFGGRARHMVENALAGAGAAIGLGLDLEVIRDGLRTFRSDTRTNVGRLNVFRLEGRIVIVDYAHNESGLDELITFSRALQAGHGRVAAIVGTAGDRGDDVLRGLGRIAAERADMVFVKENPKYLRGRASGEQVANMRTGVESVGGTSKLVGSYEGEREALIAALAATEPGDAIAIMCVEEQLGIFRELRDRGAEEWS